MAKRHPSQRRGRASHHEALKDESRSLRKEFLPKQLDRTVIALPLLDGISKNPDRKFRIIIDLNLEFKEGVPGARRAVEKAIAALGAPTDAHDGPDTYQYVFTELSGRQIRELVRRDGAHNDDKSQRAIYHIWPDFSVKRLTNQSISTVKADAAHNAFSAWGAGIVWAVLDSGIDASHPHFQQHRNLEPRGPLQHRNFISRDHAAALRDTFGHGTHVAGIIAGEMSTERGTIVANYKYRDEQGESREAPVHVDRISGMAPRCKLLSLKVLDDDGNGNGTGRASSIMAALEYIQRLNGYGRRILVHGVNLSVGYDFEPEWFACGQSPLCVEVDRLVRSGVVVVVAAGNSGYGYLQSEAQGNVAAGLDLTINDPGNAKLAITVGSTHRDSPHLYGVSYFSSKGPTGDGRMKPDLLAPGEKIISCAAGKSSARRRKGARSSKPIARYCEDSGTSMAAPHVSGVIAAFLSIRREFIRQPEEVKRIFMDSATDLQRAPYFQGRGLVDLMRAIQSV